MDPSTYTANPKTTEIRHSSEPGRRPIPVANEASSSHTDILVGCQWAKYRTIFALYAVFPQCQSIQQDRDDLVSQHAHMDDKSPPHHVIIKGSQGPTLHALQGYFPCQATSLQTPKATCEMTTGRGTSVHPRPSDHPSLLWELQEVGNWTR